MSGEFDSQSKPLSKSLNKWYVSIANQERKNRASNGNNGRLTPIQKIKFKKQLAVIKLRVLEIQRMFKEYINNLIDSFEGCKVKKYNNAEDIPPLIDMKNHIQMVRMQLKKCLKRLLENNKNLEKLRKEYNQVDMRQRDYRVEIIDIKDDIENLYKKYVSSRKINNTNLNNVNSSQIQRIIDEIIETDKRLREKISIALREIVIAPNIIQNIPNSNQRSLLQNFENKNKNNNNLSAFTLPDLLLLLKLKKKLPRTPRSRQLPAGPSGQEQPSGPAGPSGQEQPSGPSGTPRSRQLPMGLPQVPSALDMASETGGNVGQPTDQEIAVAQIKRDQIVQKQVNVAESASNRRNALGMQPLRRRDQNSLLSAAETTITELLSSEITKRNFKSKYNNLERKAEQNPKIKKLLNSRIDEIKKHELKQQHSKWLRSIGNKSVLRANPAPNEGNTGGANPAPNEGNTGGANPAPKMKRAAVAKPAPKVKRAAVAKPAPKAKRVAAAAAAAAGPGPSKSEAAVAPQPTSNKTNRTSMAGQSFAQVKPAPKAKQPEPNAKRAAAAAAAAAPGPGPNKSAPNAKQPAPNGGKTGVGPSTSSVVNVTGSGISSMVENAGGTTEQIKIVQKLSTNLVETLNRSKNSALTRKITRNVKLSLNNLSASKTTALKQKSIIELIGLLRSTVSKSALSLKKK